MYTRFALIGSTGRVGTLVKSACHDKWAGMPMQTRATDRTNTSRCLVWDVNKGADPVRAWISRYGHIDTLVVLAGVTPASDADMDTNISIAEAYLKAARAVGVRRVLLASSSAVYGSGDSIALSEDHLCTPINAYGQAKLRMEQAALTFATSAFEICCMRLGNVAGADAMLLNAPKTAVQVPLCIDQFQDGRGPRRSYIGPEQLGDILALLATHAGPLPDILNVAGTQPIYMEDLAEAAGLPWVYRAAPQQACQTIALNCALLEKLITMPQGTDNAGTIAQDWIRNKAE